MSVTENPWAVLKLELVDKTAQSRLAYESALRLWCQFLGIIERDEHGGNALCAASRARGLEFVEWLQERRGHSRTGRPVKLSPRTIANKLSLLRGLYVALM